MDKKLTRDMQHKVIGGVCAGLAEYLNMDVAIVRVLFVLAFFLKGVGLIPYIVLWIALPKKTNYLNFNDPTKVDYTVPPMQGDTFTTVPPQQAGAPFVMPPKKTSNAGIIIGVALVAFGALLLMCEFDILPDWDFGRLWPVVFIIIGAAMLFVPKKKDPWEKDDWHKTEQATETKQEDANNDVPPAV